MDICDLILRTLRNKGEIKSSDIVKITGFSRAYINKAFQKLRNDGKILLVGKANRAKYVFASETAFTKVRKSNLKVRRILENKNLIEDFVLEEIKK